MPVSQNDTPASDNRSTERGKPDAGFAAVQGLTPDTLIGPGHAGCQDGAYQADFTTRQYRPGQAAKAQRLPRIRCEALAGQLRVGDVVFIQSSALPFRKVAQTTLSWTNHVGIVVEANGPEPVIAESTFPFSKNTGVTRFVARSVQGRVEVRRLINLPTEAQQKLIQAAAQKRLGIFYDTGFNLHSGRQFCSRFVHEVLAEATGIQPGEIERFSVFLSRNRDVDLIFWRLWYFGRIPWQRQTITPASLLDSCALQTVFTGYVDRD